MPRTSPSDADHLGDDEAAAALALDEAAERRVGHARHRRDDERRRSSTAPIFIESTYARHVWISVRLDVRGVDFDADRLADQIDRQHEPRALARPCASAGR